MKKKNKKIKKKKKNFYSRAGQDGRSDEDKQTIFFFDLMYSHQLPHVQIVHIFL